LINYLITRSWSYRAFWSYWWSIIRL